MTETPGRLLRLLSLLQGRREWTGAELAGRLGVSRRTVRNDVERLRRLGYPVPATRGSAGGYRLGAGADLPPLLLEDDEAVAVAVGLRGAAVGAIAGIEETALRALAKLERVLPARLRRRVTALHASLVTVPPQETPPPVDPAVLTLLAGACRDRLRLRFDYRDHGDAASRRTVDPYRLVNWGRRWYLVGWDAGREDWRTFRVDRLRPLLPAGPAFPPREPPAEDLADYVARRVAGAAWRYRARILVHAPAASVLERINPAVGTVEAVDDGTCILDTGADTVETIAVYVGMLGLDFTVREPPELLRALRDLAARYTRATD